LIASPFPALTQAQTLFQTLVWNSVWATGNIALLAAFPVLKLPVVSFLEGEAETTTRDWIYNYICLFIDIEALRLVNAAHQAAYEAASIELKTIAAGTPAYQKALADAEAALSDFARWYA
jgi:hypothetical protein